MNYLSSCRLGRKNNIGDDRWKTSEFYHSHSMLPLSIDFSNARAGAGISKCRVFGILECRNLEIRQIPPKKQGISNMNSGIPGQLGYLSEMLANKQALSVGLCYCKLQNWMVDVLNHEI